MINTIHGFDGIQTLQLFQMEISYISLEIPRCGTRIGEDLI